MATSQIIGALATGGGIVDNTTRFILLGNAISALFATEANALVPIREAGTFSKLFVRVLTNTATVTSTIVLRKSAVNTVVTLTIGADATGEFEDITNSVLFAATDEASVSVAVPTESGTNTLTVCMLGLLFTPTDTAVTYTPYCCVADNQTTASATRFASLNSHITGANEAPTQVQLRGTCTARDFYVTVTSNARTTNTVFKTRKNGADGAMSVTYAGAETGVKEDTANTDSLVSGDLYNLAVTTGTGTETLAVNGVSLALSSAANQFSLFTGGDNALVQAFNVTNFVAVGGGIEVPSTTEATHQLLSRLTFTAKQLTANVTANTILTSASTIRSRINGADGNQVVSYATIETGIKSDITNTDTITAGSSRYNFTMVTPNTSGNLSIGHIGMLGEIAAAGMTGPLIGGRLVDGRALLGGRLTC